MDWPKRDQMMTNEIRAELAVRVDPADMLQYVYELMVGAEGEGADTSARIAARQWGADTPVAHAAELRWGALNRAFGDARVRIWTGRPQADQIHVPAALIAAAGVAPLAMADHDVVFDIPTLLDVTLQMSEPAGHG